MAGHSKWANTKHRKASQDAKRGNRFTKIIREIVTATKLGGSVDTEYNPRLRSVIDKALANNMNRNTLNRAISRGRHGHHNNDIMHTIIYEGYGPGGIAVIVECLSDNRNRTLSEVRHAFLKFGGNLGCVSHCFNKKVAISFSTELVLSKEAIILIAREAGVENNMVIYNNGTIEVYTAPELVYDVQKAFLTAGFKKLSSKIEFIPFIYTTIDKYTMPKLLDLIDMLESCDDVEKVYHNGDIEHRS